MENDFARNRDARRDAREKQSAQRETQQREEARFQPETADAGLAHAAQLLQSGARLRDLSPEDVREVAAAVGNQTMLQFLRSGGGGVPLAPAPPGLQAGTVLPETEVAVRWPALCAPPVFARDGPLPGGVFPVEAFRPMGHRCESGVMPDG